MARYDRVANLDPPDRSTAFSGWSVFRDLERRERNTDLARRARLRFLALRIVKRLIAEGLDNVSSHSIREQIESVREELGSLPVRDPERVRLSEFLSRIQGLEPLELAVATLDLGEAAEADGLTYTAEEFYHAALDLANLYQLRESAVPRETSRTQS